MSRESDFEGLDAGALRAMGYGHGAVIQFPGRMFKRIEWEPDARKPIVLRYCDITGEPLRDDHVEEILEAGLSDIDPRTITQRLTVQDFLVMMHRGGSMGARGKFQLHIPSYK